MTEDIGVRFAKQTLAERREHASTKQQLSQFKQQGITQLRNLLQTSVDSYNAYPGIEEDGLSFAEEKDSFVLSDDIGLRKLRLSFIDDELRLTLEGILDDKNATNEVYRFVANGSEVLFKHAYFEGIEALSAEDLVVLMFSRVLS